MADITERLREAAQGEPVAWVLKTGHGTVFAAVKPECEVDLWVPLYTAPPAPRVDVDRNKVRSMLWNAIRGLGYTTAGQTDEVVEEALRAIFNQGSEA